MSASAVQRLHGYPKTEAERAAESQAEEVTVSFDPRFHYPARIDIDRWRGAIDDELAWVAELTVLR